MKIPELKPGKVSVIRAESATGIILNNDGVRYQSAGEDFYKIFDNMEDAKHYIVNDKISSVITCEYLIYNSQGVFTEMIS